MKSYGQFVKIASDKMGDDLDFISVETANSAYELYTKLPVEKKASTLLNLYEVITPGEDLLALDMVAYNVKDDMEKTAVVGAAMNLGKAALSKGVGFMNSNLGQAVMWGPSMVSSISDGLSWVKDKLFGSKKKREQNQLQQFAPMSSGNSPAPYSNTY